MLKKGLVIVVILAAWVISIVVLLNKIKFLQSRMIELSGEYTYTREISRDKEAMLERRVGVAKGIVGMYANGLQEMADELPAYNCEPEDRELLNDILSYFKEFEEIKNQVILSVGPAIRAEDNYIYVDIYTIEIIDVNKTLFEIDEYTPSGDLLKYYRVICRDIDGVRSYELINE